MTTINKTAIDEKIRDGYKFDFEKYISDGFNLCSKEWFLFSLYTLVYFILIYLASLTIIGGILLSYPLMLGFVVGAEKVNNGESLGFGDFFGGFKNFWNLVLLTLIIYAVIIILVVPLVVVMVFTVESIESASYGYNGPSTGLILFTFVYGLFAIVAGLYLAVSMVFSPYLIHYGDYSAGEALRTSFALSKKNFWKILIFLILCYFIAMIGYFACGIGMLFTLAAALCMHYPMVKDILLSDYSNEIDEIGQHNYTS